LNLAPADVTTFTIRMNSDETTRFTKQQDGGWSALQLPNKDLGVFYVDGTKLRTHHNGKQHKQDFAKMLGVDENPEWQGINEVQVGSTTSIQIERRESGLELIMNTERGDDPPVISIWEVHWGTPESE